MKNKKWILAAIFLLLTIPSAVAIAAYSRTFTLTGSVSLNLPTSVPTSAPTPTPEPTQAPTVTSEATPNPEATPTPEVTATAEITATPENTTTPDIIPTPTALLTPTLAPTATPTPTPAPTPVKTVKITYYSVLGGHTYSEYVPQNSTITLQGEIFSYPGWVQVGWSTYAGASYPQYDLGDSYNTKKKAIKLYAVWDIDWGW